MLYTLYLCGIIELFIGGQHSYSGSVFKTKIRGLLSES